MAVEASTAPRIFNGFGEITNFIWSVADLLRGDYKQADYGKVILPLTVLRRLDCVLAPNREQVLKKAESLKGEHRIMLKIDWCRSPVLAIQVASGSTVELVASPGGGPLMALWAISFGHANYIRLQKKQ
jgi:type I restriction-modification system DNA methylase subunit